MIKKFLSLIVVITMFFSTINVFVWAEEKTELQDNILDVSLNDEILENVIANVDGVNYVSLQEAIDAAKEESSDHTIRFKKDVDLTNTGVVDVSGLTLDLEGHIISAVNFSLIFEGHDFIIKNGSFDAKGGSYALFIGDEGEKNNHVVIENLTLMGGINIYNTTNVFLRNLNVMGSDYYAVWCDENGHVTIESGIYSTRGTAVFGLAKGGNPSLLIEGGMFNTNGRDLVLGGEYSKPEIRGGIFDVEVASEYCAEGFINVNNGNGTYRVEFNLVATIGDRQYTSLQTAVNAAKDGEIIELYKDVMENVSFNTGKEIILDLNGNTIVGNESWVLNAETNNKKVTVESGHISGGTTGAVGSFGGEFILNDVEIESSGYYGVAAINEGTIVSINNSSVTASKAVHAGNSGTVIINSGNVHAAGGNAIAIDLTGGNVFINEKEGKTTTITSDLNGIALFNYENNAQDSTPSHVEMTGGTVVAENCALFGNDFQSIGSVAKITGGKLISNNKLASAVYWPMEGTLTINGDAEIVGATAVEVKKGTVLIEGNATLKGNGESNGKFPPASNDSLADGSALKVVTEEYNESENQYITEQNINVNLLGGILISKNSNVITVYNAENIKGQKANIVVSKNAVLNMADGNAQVVYFTKGSQIDLKGSIGKVTVSSNNTILNASAVAITSKEKSVKFYATFDDALIGNEKEILIMDAVEISYETLLNHRDLKLASLTKGLVTITNVAEDKEAKVTYVAVEGKGIFTVMLSVNDKQEDLVDPTPFEPQPSLPVATKPSESQINRPITPIQDEEKELNEESNDEEIKENDTWLGLDNNAESFESENIEENDMLLSFMAVKKWILPIICCIVGFIIFGKHKKKEKTLFK